MGWYWSFWWKIFEKKNFFFSFEKIFVLSSLSSISVSELRKLYVWAIWKSSQILGEIICIKNFRGFEFCFQNVFIGHISSFYKKWLYFVSMWDNLMNMFWVIFVFYPPYPVWRRLNPWKATVTGCACVIGMEESWVLGNNSDILGWTYKY